MKKILFALVLLLAGIGTGGGAGYAAARMLGPASASASAAPAPEPAEAEPHFVPAGKVLAPLVRADGSLSGYEQFEIQLDVAEDKVEFVTARLPLLLHEINMRTYRTPMASGPDGMLPNVDSFRKIAKAAADVAFGGGIVKRVTITGATPA